MNQWQGKYGLKRRIRAELRERGADRERAMRARNKLGAQYYHGYIQGLEWVLDLAERIDWDDDGEK